MDDTQQPLFTFGVIADIQYADIDDGYNYSRTRMRYYRNSLEILRRAKTTWSRERVQPGFILQLGDVIDGFNRDHKSSERALKKVMKELQTSRVDVHHVWGNHELYNFTRKELMTSVLNSKPASAESRSSCCHGQPLEADDDEGYYAYDFSPAPHFRFVILDAYDLSALGRKKSSKKYSYSMKLLKEHNRNDNFNKPPKHKGADVHFVMYNGGFSQEQLDWLDGVLTRADEEQEKVTVVSHIPVHPSSTMAICLAWNYESMLNILNSHKSVVCFMAGHDHDGGYHVDTNGVHHITFEGVVETPPDEDAFGTVYVYKDRMILKGYGRVKDQTLIYP